MQPVACCINMPSAADSVKAPRDKESVALKRILKLQQMHTEVVTKVYELVVQVFSLGPYCKSRLHQSLVAKHTLRVPCLGATITNIRRIWGGGIILSHRE